MKEDKLLTAPVYLTRSLLFPYLSGAQFVEALFEKGGWQEVNEAFKKPPSSTEQVLHPEKYGVDKPTYLSLPDLSNTLGDGWKLLYENVLGEFGISVLLEDVKDSKLAAEGWDGDFYRAYVYGNGKIILAWVSLWDTIRDCDEFYNALLMHIKNWGYEAGEGDFWEKGGEQIAVFKAGKFVLFIKGQMDDVRKLSEFLRRWLENEAGALFPQQ